MSRLAAQPKRNRNLRPHAANEATSRRAAVADGTKPQDRLSLTYLHRSDCYLRDVGYVWLGVAWQWQHFMICVHTELLPQHRSSTFRIS